MTSGRSDTREMSVLSLLHLSASLLGVHGTTGSHRGGSGSLSSVNTNTRWEMLILGGNLASALHFYISIFQHDVDAHAGQKIALASLRI